MISRRPVEAARGIRLIGRDPDGTRRDELDATADPADGSNLSGGAAFTLVQTASLTMTAERRGREVDIRRLERSRSSRPASNPQLGLTGSALLLGLVMILTNEERVAT